MALGFQRQGIFGRRTPQAMPGAMPIGVANMSEPKKGGIFGKGSKLWDALGTFGDVFSESEPLYAIQKAERERALMEAEKERQRALEPIKLGDSLIRPDGAGGYKEVYSAPQKPANNDTINDFNWYKSLPEEERKLYHQMKPVVGYMADGTPRVINPYEAQQPNLDSQPASEDGYDYVPGPGGRANPSNWKKSGGQAATPPATFRQGL